MPNDDEEDELQIEHLDEEEESEPPFYGITSYGADYPVESIVQRIRSGDFFIPTFQRAYIWNTKRASQFIESLLLGLPVPGIFIAREHATNKHLVIDGSQRLRTLQYFFDSIFGPTKRAFELQGVAKQFEGRSFNTLDAADRRRLQDSIIHTTVVRQDHPSDDDSGIFQVFRRLNLGGTPLSPQEVRHALYHGALVQMIEQLNRSPDWRILFGPENSRLRDQQMILRFLAMVDNHQNYRKPLSSFLNSYMKKHRNIDDNDRSYKTKIFLVTIQQIREHVGPSAFRPVRNFNAAFFEAMSVGLALALREKDADVDGGKIKLVFDKLTKDKSFLDLVTQATSDEDRVKERIRVAKSEFRGH